MENIFKILNNRLDEQLLIGKEYLSINEIKNILEQVNVLVSQAESIDTKKDFCTKEQRDTFNEIVSKFTGTKKVPVNDVYPDSVFYMVGDSVYMEQDLKTGNFYIRYTYFWEVFETKFELNYKEISQLLQGLLEEHLNCVVNTTTVSTLFDSFGWKNILIVYEHNKSKDNILAS